MSQRKVVLSLGTSLGRANYCLRALVEKGFLKAQNYRNSKNRLGYLYVLTPSGIAAKAGLTQYFLARKMLAYGELRREIEQLRMETEGTQPH